jgi:hypothetical protein
MTEYHSMFIEFAASVTSKSFNIAVATATRNGKPHLLLKLELKYSWSNPANQWANGYYDYETSRQVPGTWKGSRSPWEAMSFAGEFASDRVVTTNGPNAPKFCSICGNRLVPEAKFCPGCGTSLKRPPSVDAPQSQSLIGHADFSEGGNLKDSVSTKLAELVVSTLFQDFAPNERTVLLAFLIDDFNEASVNSVIDGRISTSSALINLANMQSLQVAVTSEKSLSAAEVKLAELALRESPICFGYWGALKALLKYQPEKVSKEALGAGFARISESGSIYTSWWNNDGKFEDIRFLSEIHGTPSAKTRYYLSRRGRRDLIRLSRTDVNDYLAMSTGFLLSANRGTSPTDFMLGQILFGSGKYLNKRSRSVRRTLGEEPLEPYRPELWKNSTAELNKLWLGVSNSRLIQDFTFSLASRHKIQLLPLQGRPVNLAMQSEIPELRKFVIDQIVGDPDNWDELDEDGWRTFISEVDEKMLPLILSSIGSVDYTYSLENAIEKVLDAIDDPHSFRMQQLALLYFILKPEYTYWGRNPQFEGKAAAAVLFSGSSKEVRDSNLLSERLGFQGLLVCWSVANRHGGTSEEINKDFHDAARNYWSNLDLSGRLASFNLIATLAPEWFADLGSSLIARDYDFDLVRAFIENCYELTESKSSVTDALISLMLVSPAHDLSRLLREALSRDDIAGAISLGDILNQSGHARSLAWLELAEHEDSDLGSALRLNKHLLVATMLELRQADVANARGFQISLLMSFFNTAKTQEQIPGSLLIGAASNPSGELASLGNKLLKKRGLLGQHWLALAETQMPLAIGFAREFVRSLPQADLSPAVLLGADSPVGAVRDMALELLDTLRDKIDLAFVYTRLAESRDPAIRGRVAEEALLAPWSDGNDLIQFDSELLVTLRRTRSARENIKTRIDTLVTNSSEPPIISDERISALISLTRIGNSRDREWALARIAQLKIAGVDVEGVTLSFANGGGQNV